PRVVARHRQRASRQVGHVRRRRRGPRLAAPAHLGSRPAGAVPEDAPRLQGDVADERRKLDPRRLVRRVEHRSRARPRREAEAREAPCRARVVRDRPAARDVHRGALCQHLDPGVVGGARRAAGALRCERRRERRRRRRARDARRRGRSGPARGDRGSGGRARSDGADEAAARLRRRGVHAGRSGPVRACVERVRCRRSRAARLARPAEPARDRGRQRPRARRRGCTALVGLQSGIPVRARSAVHGDPAKRTVEEERNPLMAMNEARRVVTVERHTEWKDEFARPRVVLQPFAAPSVLGLYGFAAATFMVALHLTGVYGGVKTNGELWPFAAVFGGIAQFLAGMWAYRVRDTIATAMHGMWGSFWIAFGILNILIMTGLVPLVPPGSKSDPAFAMWFWTLGAITAAGALAALAENFALVAVLATLSAGSFLFAIGLSAGSTGVVKVAGW